MELSAKNLLIGFIAGAIATVTAHEIIALVLLKAGLFPRVPWPMTPAAGTGVPQFISDMFWGGLWGVLFAAAWSLVPGSSLTMKGLIFGVLGPALLGVFILVPLLTGRIPIFLGGDLQKIACVLLILGGFGAAMGFIYQKLAASA